MFNYNDLTEKQKDQISQVRGLFGQRGYDDYEEDSASKFAIIWEAFIQEEEHRYEENIRGWVEGAVGDADEWYSDLAFEIVDECQARYEEGWEAARKLES